MLVKDHDMILASLLNQSPPSAVRSATSQVFHCLLMNLQPQYDFMLSHFSAYIFFTFVLVAQIQE